MKIVHTEYIIRSGAFPSSPTWEQYLDEISKAIRSVVWPPGATDFRFSDEGIGRGRGEGNGVVPIKLAFCSQLKEFGWNLETPLRIASRKNPGKLDATKGSPDGRLVAVEWETGNISSSHRATNKMILGILKGVLCAGVLVLPTREMYRFLTDRIGNFEELSPYFDLWRAISIHDGLLVVVAVEQDGTTSSAPRIPKGTDGRALS